MNRYKVQMEDLVAQVYRALKEMILFNQLLPGQKLVQKNLAETLDVSRTPLQSAFSKLEQELLVQYIPRRGYFVRKLNLEEALELFDVRLRLEPFVARKAAEKRDEATVRRLRDLAEPDDPERIDEKPNFNEYDYRFHFGLIEICNSEILKRIISSINLVHLSNQTEHYYNAAKSIEHHHLLVDAVEKGDGDAAEKIMLEHLAMGRENLIGQGGRAPQEAI